MAPLLGTIKYLAFYFYSHLFFQSCLPFGHFGKMKVMAFPLIFSREYGGSEGEWASCPRLVLAESGECPILQGTPAHGNRCGPRWDRGQWTRDRPLLHPAGCLLPTGFAEGTGWEQRPDSSGPWTDFVVSLERACDLRFLNPGTPIPEYPASYLPAEIIIPPIISKIYLWQTSLN